MTTNNVEKISQTKEQNPETLVQILLNGGHKYRLTLKPDSPLLKNLLATIFNKVKNPSNRTVFQIPLKVGQAGLCFSSDDLVGIITEPPVYISPQGQPEKQENEPQKQEIENRESQSD